MRQSCSSSSNYCQFLGLLSFTYHNTSSLLARMDSHIPHKTQSFELQDRDLSKMVTQGGTSIDGLPRHGQQRDILLRLGKTPILKVMASSNCISYGLILCSFQAQLRLPVNCRLLVHNYSFVGCCTHVRNNHSVQAIC